MTDEDQRWLEGLTDQDRERAEGMLQNLRAMGCDDPLSWARSEMSEDIAQVARFRFLHRLRPQMIDTWQRDVDGLWPVERAIADGVRREDLVRLARHVAAETVHAVLYHLEDDGMHGPLADRLPFWRLMEVDGAGRPTGRGVGGLFESLADPDDDLDE
ncbi:hypothetical protein Cs7R123_47180 [Catellatospora sp. TT07R-123]|uniref:hypothetical protein n=1 Tax=Catellatospora sp. TT07R-123 TaxID=2733863 RepID=UPI001B2185DC|nr:hypothetical protein [Catellatospora sp. TT07R-123]GHJ47376.1 hypothetical protein Cs7R123_47180 [Catellatospora sp. TT07R-123]